MIIKSNSDENNFFLNDDSTHRYCGTDKKRDTMMATNVLKSESNDKALKNDFRVYGNPAAGIIIVEFYSGEPATGLLNIYFSDGRLLK